MVTPKLAVREDGQDISVQIRVQQVANGFLVRTGNIPIYYSSIEKAAAAVSDSLIQVTWPLTKG
jgi:hypothetical protein